MDIKDVIVGCIVFLISFCSFNIFAQSSLSISEIIEGVNSLIAEEKFDEADRQLSAALTSCDLRVNSDRCRARLHHTRGDLYVEWAQFNLAFAQGDLNEAEDLYIWILRDSPNTPQLITTLALIYRDLEAWEPVRKLLTQAADQDPNLADTYLLLLGNLLLDGGQTDAAIDVYEATVGIVPNSIEANYGLLKAYGRGDKVELLLPLAIQLLSNNFPGLASEAIESAMTRSDGEPVEHEDDLLVIWTEARARMGNLTRVSLKRLPAILESHHGKLELAAYLGAPDGGAGQLDWWLDSPERANAFLHVAGATAANLRRRGELAKAVSILEDSLELASRFDTYSNGIIKRRLFVGMENALILASLYDLQGKDSAFDSLVHDYFSEPSLATQDDSERYQIGLGVIYSGRENRSPNWAEKSILYLENALMTVTDRPDLEVRLADAYSAAEIFDKAAVLRDKTFLAYIDRGDLRRADSTLARADIREFDVLLNRAQATKDSEETLSQTLELKFNEYEAQIIERWASLEDKAGSLTELKGVFKQFAVETQRSLQSSITSAQFPHRNELLAEIAKKTDESPASISIEDIETLGLELRREIVESGRVSKFTTSVYTADGRYTPRKVVRVGAFHLVSNGQYLNFDPAEIRISEPARQAISLHLFESVARFEQPENEIVSFGIDVTRGSVLSLLVESPGLSERVKQGGIIGSSIIALGMIGLLISIWRYLELSNDERKVVAQLNRDSASTNNPLGRILTAYESNKNADTKTIELKLSEAALKEIPNLTKGLLFIKVIAVVAPLMGLIGMVIGTIETFQTITLYGAGDPKLMAGGISRALMTTVLGLIVAIPMVLLHTIVSGRSKKIMKILESQRVEIVAHHSEQYG